MSKFGKSKHSMGTLNLSLESPHQVLTFPKQAHGSRKIFVLRKITEICTFWCIKIIDLQYKTNSLNLNIATHFSNTIIICFFDQYLGC